MNRPPDRRDRRPPSRDAGYSRARPVRPTRPQSRSAGSSRRPRRSAGQRRRQLLIAGLALVLILLVGVLIYSFAGAGSAAPKKPSGPVVYYSPLDGLVVSKSVASRRPVAVMIDNCSCGARPQSGLGSASLVFETLAEGGITRYMAVYLDHSAPEVGPIRSARPYFVRWAAGYKAIYAHAGGSPAALHTIKRLSARHVLADVNGLLGYSEFYRTAVRPAPHNLYASVNGIRKIAQQQHANHPVSYVGFSFKSPAPFVQRRRQRVQIGFSTTAIESGGEYAVAYRYDRHRNVYWRRVGGVADMDHNTRGKQIAPTNVVVLITPIGPIPNDAESRVSVGVLGTGEALFFHDGSVAQGSWTKKYPSSALRLLNAQGQPEKLDPGQTWIEGVSDKSNVTYSQ